MSDHYPIGDNHKFAANISTENRVKILSLPDWFDCKGTMTGVPLDAVILGWRYNLILGHWFVLIHHKSFETVDEGSRIGTICVTVEETT